MDNQTKIEITLHLTGPLNGSITQEQLLQLNKDLQKTAIQSLSASNMIISHSDTKIINQPNAIQSKPKVGSIVSFNGELFQVVEASLKNEKIKIMQNESKETKTVSYLDVMLVQ
jgi:hypothetical protein